jgi:predicted metal-dependent peptidase
MSRILENAIVRLLKVRPFYGHLLVGLRREASGAPFPLGVTLRDGTPLLLLHEELFAGYPPAEQEALLEHCVKHLLHLHMARRKERHGRDWDMACDLAINPGIAGMPSGAPRPAQFALPGGLAAEEYYRLLTVPFDCGNLTGEGAGQAEQDQGGAVGDGAAEAPGGTTPTAAGQGSPIDDHGAWDEADSTPLRLAEELVRGMVRDAWQKCDGRVPADLLPLVSGWLAPPSIPWRQLLRQFVATAGRLGRQSTWQRENRRFAHATPGTRKRHRLNLLIGVDVSDSTDAPALREAFARELMQIARGRDAVLTVLYANSRIQRIESLRGSSVVPASYHGGGFTDLRPVFDYARTMQPRPAAVVYLTDGIGPAPERMEFPTLWVLTREGERPVPWGVELRLDI